MPPEQKNPVRFEIAVGVIVTCALGYMLFQQGLMSEKLTQAEARIDALQNDISVFQESYTQSAAPTPSLPASVPSIAPSIASPGSSDSVGPAPAPSPIQISLPKEGDVLCRDANFAFDWKLSPSAADEIMIGISSNKTPGGQVADVTTSYNETGQRGVGHYDWKIGSITFPGGNTQILPDDDFYQIYYTLIKGGSVIYSGKSDSFVLNTCKG